MTEKKIAVNVNVRINVAKYEYIDITKYAEKTISYENEEDMIKQEDQLTDELLNNLIRNMRRIPNKLGKTTDAIEQIEAKVSKTIPEWLENNVVPNVANHAVKTHNRVEAENDAVKRENKKDTSVAENILNLDEKVEAAPSSKTETSQEKTVEASDDFDLFGDDEDLFK